MNQKLKYLAAALAMGLTASAGAAVVVSEAAPWSSGNSPLAADWFELTNTGASAVTITGWTFDDNSNSFASSVLLNGITSIAAGESVIFLESASPASIVAAFKNLWFGSNAPAALQIGTYSGSGVGLSTAGDAINIFNSSGAVQANVVFGASPAGPFYTFDNAAGSSGTIAQLSSAGVNGAFVAASDGLEIGSPGRISAVPEANGMMLMLAGLASMVGLRRHKRR